MSTQVNKYSGGHKDHCFIERSVCFCEHPDVYWILSLWILCDMQSATVPIPYEFTAEDVICTKLQYYFCENINVHWIRFCYAVHRRHNILAFPDPTEEIMNN